MEHNTQQTSSDVNEKLTRRKSRADDHPHDNNFEEEKDYSLRESKLHIEEVPVEEESSLLNPSSKSSKKIPYPYAIPNSAYAISWSLEAAGILLMAAGVIAALPTLSAGLTVIAPIAVGISMFVFATAVLGVGTLSENSKRTRDTEEALIAIKKNEAEQKAQAHKIGRRKCGLGIAMISVAVCVGIVGVAAAAATLTLCLTTMSTALAVLGILSVVALAAATGIMMGRGAALLWQGGSFFNSPVPLAPTSSTSASPTYTT